MIGNGPSSAQIVPAIAPEVARLVVFQRTPNWFYPRGDRPYGRIERFLFRHLPGYARLHRGFIYLQRESLYAGFRQGSLAARFLDRTVRKILKRGVADPELRARLTPDYPPGCKRIIVSDDFLPTLQRGNVTLETDAIARITPTGIVTESGASHEVDVIVYGTGFRSTEFVAPIEIAGAARREPEGALGGRRRSLLRHHRRRLSQHVHPLWPKHQSRAQFDHLHGRAAGRPHDAPGRDPVPPRAPVGRGAARRHGGL